MFQRTQGTLGRAEGSLDLRGFYSGVLLPSSHQFLLRSSSPDLRQFYNRESRSFKNKGGEGPNHAEGKKKGLFMMVK